MNTFVCHETLFQLWAIDRLVQKLKHKDPALPNHDRHVSVEIARLATNVVTGFSGRATAREMFHATPLGLSQPTQEIARRPGTHVRMWYGCLYPIYKLVPSFTPDACCYCRVVLVTETEAYPVPAPRPLHWRVYCRKGLMKACRPCHDLNCPCGGADDVRGLVHAKASYEK